MATDAALAKIQNHLAAQPGESTGYISPQDIINAFQAALVAVDEVESHLPPQTAAVVTELTLLREKNRRRLPSVKQDVWLQAMLR